MTADQRTNLVLAFARVLYVNGQATEQMVDAAKRPGCALGLRTTIIPRWGELQLGADSKDAALAVQTGAAPAGVEMDRVASAMQAIEDIAAGRLAPDAAKRTIDEISRSPPSPTGLFALAAAAGAVALAVIFGVQHISAAILIFVSAGAGAVVQDFDFYRHLSACFTCPLRSRCTPTKLRRIKRWEHQDVLDRMQDRLDRMPEAMGVRRQTVEHPFGTPKAWMGATHFLTRTSTRSEPR